MALQTKMTIQEVYEKYEHLDRLLSDKEFLPDDPRGHILYDLWQAVRTYASINRCPECNTDVAVMGHAFECPLFLNIGGLI